MKIFSDILVKSYKNIKHADLKGLGDLNIIIGPNNCGKTNLLKFIRSLNNLRFGPSEYFLCQKCKNLARENTDISLSLDMSNDDFYLKEQNRTETMVSFLLDEEQINQLVPDVLQIQKDKLDHKSCEQISSTIVMERLRNKWSCYPKHFSIFIHNDIIDVIKRNILYCPEQRLQTYNDKDFREYIRDMKFTGDQLRKWIHFLKKVDPKISDYKYEDLVRNVDDNKFVTSISEQGSGVRSLACLAVDILFSDAKIVLIDEPELGLNPFVKQEFLNFLLEQSKGRQIFIATQDPTFVNPILWKDKIDKVSVYLFSPIEEKFVKIDLKQNQNDPNTFAGYLPHTTSLKDLHLYVEGTSDVYIFQILLEKHLKKNWPENWIASLNKVGIYHLNGDNWSHLLYTIPKTPYRCVVVLDGDKRDIAEKVCNKYNKLAINAATFKFCKTIEDVKSTFGKGSHPVYCLKQECIENYFIPDFDCVNPPQGYNKKKDGAKKAEELGDVPEEITKIFEVILEGVNVGSDPHGDI